MLRFDKARSRLAGLSLATLMAVCGSLTAEARLYFRNSTPDMVWVAFQYYSPSTCGDLGLWQVLGWFQVAPGQTKEVLRAKLERTDETFYYAASSNGLVWQGPWNRMRVPTTRFAWCLNIGSTSDLVRDVGFRQVLTGHRSNLTVNLTR